MTTIITKNSSTASSVPVAGDLTKGELAVNVTDKKLYTKDNGGSVVKLVGSLGNQEASAVAITGGTIDGTPIGGTTASTASFTTVSASGNVTLSGGTANGVLYLNGSKVATSGSALTFDGTNLGVGVAVPGQVIDASAANPRLKLTATSTGYAASQFVNSSGSSYFGRDNSAGGFFGIANGTVVYSSTNDPIGFYLGGSEQMRLTSTSLYTASGINVGIGTSFPGYKLDVLGTSRIYQSGNAAASLMLNANQGTISTGYAFTLAQSSSAGNYNFTISEGATTYLTLTNSISGAGGNLGLGVTPSAWNSTYGQKAIQFGPVGSIASIQASTTNNQTSISSNLYDVMVAPKYLYEDAASSFKLANGQFYWYIAPSGAAGSAAAFTTAMTLDASGRLGIGDTAPVTVLSLISSNQPTHKYTGVANGFAWGQFNSSGDASINNVQNANLLFATNNTERARIDSSGNLLVGTTSNSYGNKLLVACATGADGAIETAVTQTTNSYQIRFVNGNGLVGAILTNGSATAYNTSSDYRLKENIQPMTGALAKVQALKPCTYNWKADGYDGEGFIAHELAEVVPQCVTGEKDAVDAEGKPVYQGIDTSFLVATLTAAIQEQQAIINDLRARVAQLESN